MIELAAFRRARRCLMLAAVTLALSGCSFFNLDQNRPGFEVINRTSGPVDVTLLRGAQRFTISNDLLPGDSGWNNGLVIGGKCQSDSLVATDQTGAVVGTFPGPVCDGTMWEIGLGDP